MNIEEEIKKIAEMKHGDKESAIFYDPRFVNKWAFHLGNPSGAVSLGESLGECITEGDTLEEVISMMKHEVERYNQFH